MNVYVRIIQWTQILTEIYSITYLRTAFIYKQLVAITCCGYRSRDSAMASDEPLLTFTLQQQHLHYIDFGLLYCKINSHYLHCNAYKWTFGLYFIIGIRINGLHVKHLVISSTHILTHPYFFCTVTYYISIDLNNYFSFYKSLYQLFLFYNISVLPETLISVISSFDQ